MHVDAPIVNSTSIHGEVLDVGFHEPHVVFGLAQLAHSLAENTLQWCQHSMAKSTLQILLGVI